VILSVWSNSGFSAYRRADTPWASPILSPLKELEKPGLLDRTLALEAGRNPPAQTHTRWISFLPFVTTPLVKRARSGWVSR
jgi:hypothetical protein